MQHLRSIVLRVIVAVSFTLSAIPAHGQSREVEVQSTIRRALEEFDARRWEEARTLFRRAHEMEPSARTLRAIGMASFELLDYVSAIAAFEEALTETHRSLDTAQRAEVQRLLSDARTFVASYALELTATTATITVDGAPAVIRDGMLLLNAGAHEVRTEAEGFEPDVARVHARGGISGALRVELRPAARTATETDEPVERSGETGMGVVPGAIVLGAGGAVLAISLAQSLRARSTRDEYERVCSASGVPGECLSADAARLDTIADDFARQRGSAWGLLAGGLATAGVGTVLLLFGRDGDDDATVADDVACAFDGCRLFVRGSFR